MTATADVGVTKIAREDTTTKGTFGPRSMLMSAAVGFALGVLLTVAFLPIITATTKHKHHLAALPPPTPYSEGDLQSKLTSLAKLVFGKDSVTGKYELINIRVSPHFPFTLPSITHVMLYDAAIRFRANPFLPVPSVQAPLARTECFQMLQAIYSRKLPVATISLVGYFHFPRYRKDRLVLYARSTRSIERNLAPWSSAAPNNTDRVWSHLRPHWVSPKFANYKTNG